jgi:hypothetical protein
VGAPWGGGGSPRPSAANACTFPGHACPFSVFRVVDRVSCCARAVGQVCRPDFLRARARAPGRAHARAWSIVHEPGRPTSAAVLVLFDIVRPCTPGRLQDVPMRRHVATDGRCRFVSLWHAGACPRPSTAAGVATWARARTAGLGEPGRHACTCSATLGSLPSIPAGR